PTPPTAAAQNVSGTRRPSQPFHRSLSQPSQRSGSQVDFSARTEMSCYALESQRRSAEPNDYARSEPTHQTNIKYTISHGGGAAGISVSSTITSSARGRSATPRRSQSEKVMTAVGAVGGGAGPRRAGTCSLPKLSTIHDGQEFDGAGDFVDTIDHLDPLPLEAIRGNNLLPDNLRSSQEPLVSHQGSSVQPHPDPRFDLHTSSPPPYFPQSPPDSGSCYENLSLNKTQTSPQRKSSIYANQISVESAEHPEEIFTMDLSEPVRSGGDDGAAHTKPDSPPGPELAGDYAYLKQPDDGGLGSAAPRPELDHSIDMQDVFADALDKVVPITSTPNPGGRTHRLGSAYDIPPKGDDPYDIPPTSNKPSRGDDPYDIPPTSGNSQGEKRDFYDDSSMSRRKRRGDDPYDIPPTSETPPRGVDLCSAPHIFDKEPKRTGPYNVPPTSSTPPRSRAVDLFSSPPVSDMRAGADDPYDIPPSHTTRHTDPYHIPPAAGTPRPTRTRTNLDYVPTAMARSPAQGDSPYDIPPCSYKM
ncbi:hypothetical protein EGW08_014381, partial [Elysia chlorotica]